MLQEQQPHSLFDTMGTVRSARGTFQYNLRVATARNSASLHFRKQVIGDLCTYALIKDVIYTAKFAFMV